MRRCTGRGAPDPSTPPSESWNSGTGSWPCARHPANAPARPADGWTSRGRGCVRPWRRLLRGSREWIARWVGAAERAIQSVTIPGLSCPERGLPGKKNMQQDILVNWSPQETRVAVIEAGAVQELHVERTLERGLVGNVYLGKVARVLPGMQSAFIDIGLERAAFLHVADVWHRQPDGEPPAQARVHQPQVPIERQVFEGQAIMVQVIKDPIGTKGARLSTQVSIAGRLLVFLPQDDHVGVSQKIPSEQRDALRSRLQKLVGAEGGGFILRTNGEDSSDQELADDIAYLRKTWA